MIICLNILLSCAVLVDANLAPSPRLSTFPDYSVYMKGEDLTFVCDSPMGKIGKHIAFYKNLDWIYSSQNNRYDIQSLEYDHVGSYTCDYWDGSNNSHRSNAVQVYVVDYLESPTLYVWEPQPTYARGQSITLVCSVQNNDKLNGVRFLKNYEEVTGKKANRKMDQYEITWFSYDDIGNYFCDYWIEILGRKILSIRSNAVDLTMTESTAITYISPSVVQPKEKLATPTSGILASRASATAASTALVISANTPSTTVTPSESTAITYISPSVVQTKETSATPALRIPESRASVTPATKASVTSPTTALVISATTTSIKDTYSGTRDIKLYTTIGGIIFFILIGVVLIVLFQANKSRRRKRQDKVPAPLSRAPWPEGYPDCVKRTWKDFNCLPGIAKDEKPKASTDPPVIPLINREEKAELHVYEEIDSYAPPVKKSAPSKKPLVSIEYSDHVLTSVPTAYSTIDAAPLLPPAYQSVVTHNQKRKNRHAI